MEDYIVSARKYRPATFQSVVGQTALTATLKNAISTGKLANAYLFCGPRGVGKTTCARIFAKTINCEHPGPDGEACGQCESCRSFNEELRSYNVFELDAASNNSVEDIRNLTEQVRIPPMNGKYKVYVIDEVHMLSSAAFNAFLKTLEEPPKYAIFILATTEKHKIIPTILSRCQIYDFSRISNRDIVAHLQSVAEKEGVTAEQAALDIIAEKSDGGMRDALSIFDQVVSFTGGQVTYQKTIENLNVIDYDYYFRLTDMFLEKRIPDSMLLLNDILSKGFDASHLISGLMLHLRNLMVSRDACTLPLLQVSDEMRERYSKQAARCQPKFLFRALKICNDCDLNYRISKNKRLLVELALIQIAQADEDDDSHGRKPTRLKPIFKKNAAPQQAAPAPAKSQTAATPVEPKPATQVTPKPAATSAVPTFKGGVFTSIYGNGAGRPDQVHGRQTVKVIMQENDVPAKPLTEDLLQMRWTQFAAGLGRQDTPLKNRMVNCIPSMLSPDSFCVTAGNPMMAQEIESAKDRILAFIRNSFNNPSITMGINVDQSRGVELILTRDEQYARMKEESPALKELDRIFSLELR
ncbi:MAG: DNA polymerase III subunit gamma/tau [Bacteroidetes bacterium]|nr:DNA polymerase III subunit gamma/tau [Candidatus Colenecus caballi]